MSSIRQKIRTKHKDIPLKTRIPALEEQIEYGRTHGFSRPLMKRYRTELKSLKLQFRREKEIRKEKMKRAREVRLKDN